MSSVIQMDCLEQLIVHYREFPVLVLLRTLEVEQLRTVHSLCASPILDLGCGDGLVAKLAFEHSVDVGLDIDRQSLKEASAIGIYRAAINADARHLPFKDNTFCTVFSNSAMEHINDLDALLDEIARILKKDGILVTLVPSHLLLKPVGRIGKLFGQRVWDKFNRLQNHVNLLDENQWRSILSKHGLKVKLLRPYCSYAIASYIFDSDLCGKLHFNFRWPFLHLRHCGNLGLLIGRISLPYLKRIFAAYSNPNRQGYCFMILAAKLS